jgi:hypothetical protein
VAVVALEPVEMIKYILKTIEKNTISFPGGFQ